MYNKFFLTFILAAIVGFIGGLQGNAGSVYLLAGLLALGISKDQKEAAGTTLLFTALPITLGSAYEYYKQGNIDVHIAIILCIVGFIFSTLGAQMNYRLTTKFIEYSMGVTMGLSAIYFFWRAYHLD